MAVKKTTKSKEEAEAAKKQRELQTKDPMVKVYPGRGHARMMRRSELETRTNNK